MSDVAILDRTLPHNLEAERSVLGAVLIHNAALDAAAQVIDPDDFYRDAHRVLFRHMLALDARREPIDLVTLKDSLTRSHQLDEVGGPAYIAALIDGIPRSTNVAYYAGIVREKSTLRRIIYAGNKAVALAYDAEDEAAAVLDQAQQDLFGISTLRNEREWKAIPDVLDEVMPVLEKLHESGGPVTGVPTGLIELDEQLRGLQPADLVLLAARPSMGKTALALNVAFHASTVAQKHVAIFSLEMSRVQLGFRLLIAAAQIDGHRLMSGMVRESEWGHLSMALSRVSEARIHIDDSSQVSVHEMRAKARRLKASVGLDLIIVDYLQLMRSSVKVENRNLELGAISRALKGLAKDLDVPVLALSQLNRQLESRADKRPLLSDLRESGALEQDADVVLFIYRDEIYHPDTEDRGIAELIIGKHRNGPIGMVRAVYNAQTMRFMNLARHAA